MSLLEKRDACQDVFIREEEGEWGKGRYADVSLVYSRDFAPVQLNLSVQSSPHRHLPPAQAGKKITAETSWWLYEEESP